MNILQMARDWQQIKQQMALNWAGSAEGAQALADAQKLRVLCEEIEKLQNLLDDEKARSGAFKIAYEAEKLESARLFSRLMKKDKVEK